MAPAGMPRLCMGLFSDTMGGETVLLTDETSCASGAPPSMKNRVQRTSHVEPGQSVIQASVVGAFSGHGSETHEIVTYDTDPYDIPGTSIPLTSLGEWCARIPCRRLLVVLDCCFSGGMGAKALQVDARARSLDSVDAKLNRISGEGRVVLTAS